MGVFDPPPAVVVANGEATSSAIWAVDRCFPVVCHCRAVWRIGFPGDCDVCVYLGFNGNLTCPCGMWACLVLLVAACCCCCCYG